MTKKDIEALKGEFITEEQLEEIELSEDVTSVDNMGYSGAYPGANWFSVEFQDGENIDVYVKY